MANERGKSIDNTHLSIDQAEARGFIHRDYIAHCLRWTHVAKVLNIGQRWKTARIMDIGCGVDLPLARLLYTSRYIVESYIGVDYNRPEKFKLEPFHTGAFPIHAYGGVDFANHDHVGFLRDGDRIDLEVCGEHHPMPNVWVCFEMLEHIEPEHVRRVLDKVQMQMRAAQLTAGADPIFFLSTPNYDPGVGAAANHVNEMKHNALGYLLEEMGFKIKARYGTFASKRDINHHFEADFADGRELLRVFDEYYDSNYMATILAPLYPVESRNCLWQLTVPTAGEDYLRYYNEVDPMEIIPWSSSSLWPDLIPTLGASVSLNPDQTAPEPATPDSGSIPPLSAPTTTNE